MCDKVFFFFFFLSNIIIFLLKKILDRFSFLESILDWFVLKTQISRRVSYFVDILNRVGDIFLPNCPQIFSLLNVKFRDIFEPYKSPIQKGESSYK